MKYPIVKAVVVFCSFVAIYADAMAGERMPVFVSIQPQKYFVEKIGGNLTDVSILVASGANVHSYEPKPRQLLALAKSEMYFTVGTRFEKVLLKKLAGINPDMLIVHTESGIEKIPMKAHDHHKDRMHGESSHHEGIRDPHIWLSPRLVKIQAENILKGLTKSDPGHGPDYEKNFNMFIRETDLLDSEIRKIFSEKGKHNRFMVFHPSWGYFAEDYGLEQVPIEAEGKEPGPAQLKALIEYAGKQGIRVIFAQPQFSDRSAKIVAKAIGAQLVPADPFAGDWAGNLREMAGKIKAALK